MPRILDTLIHTLKELEYQSSQDVTHLQLIEINDRIIEIRKEIMMNTTLGTIDE